MPSSGSQPREVPPAGLSFPGEAQVRQNAGEEMRCGAFRQRQHSASAANGTESAAGFGGPGSQRSCERPLHLRGAGPAAMGGARGQQGHLEPSAQDRSGRNGTRTGPWRSEHGLDGSCGILPWPHGQDDAACPAMRCPDGSCRSEGPAGTCPMRWQREAPPLRAAAPSASQGIRGQIRSSLRSTSGSFRRKRTARPCEEPGAGNDGSSGTCTSRYAWQAAWIPRQ